MDTPTPLEGAGVMSDFYRLKPLQDVYLSGRPESRGEGAAATYWGEQGEQQCGHGDEEGEIFHQRRIHIGGGDCGGPSTGPYMSRERKGKTTHDRLLNRATATSQAALTTLISRTAAQETGGAERPEVMKEIEELREGIRKLRAENLKLQENLQTSRAQGADPAELADEVGRALGAVKLMARRSNTLKGTFTSLLNRATTTTQAAMTTLIARAAAQDVGGAERPERTAGGKRAQAQAQQAPTDRTRKRERAREKKKRNKARARFQKERERELAQEGGKGIPAKKLEGLGYEGGLG
ncbi:hypothetical protein EAI_06635 [Harpegnathos saltator]|uniref:Uncharacterized protein n=1 Tax=Harpegnathos saltator TaxID=610380 RepID=E2BPC5_HARSA|nr:hypothetical protein EAI_06635 [Harpegnathos saltator]